MAVGSAATSIGSPSEKFQARLQHLSAGVLIGAVITEIFPILHEHLMPGGDRRAADWTNSLAAIVGFAAALALMYGLSSLDANNDDAAPPEAAATTGTSASQDMVGGLTESLLVGGDQQAALQRSDTLENAVWTSTSSLLGEEGNKLRSRLTRLQAQSANLSRLVEADAEQVDRDAVDEAVHGIDFTLDSCRRLCRGADPIDTRNAARLRFHVEELAADIAKLRSVDAKDIKALYKQLRVARDTLRHIHHHAERATFRRWAPRPRRSTELEAPPAGAVPWGLIVAVLVDSCVDGMLIGLAGSVASSSGWLMALATAIEMGFLGYSFACTVTKSMQCFRAVLVLALPPLGMLAASAGAGVGATYVEKTPVFSGLIAFALVAVLFLVVDELLLEAHEKEDGQEWHISIFLYFGLFLSVSFDVLL